MPKPQFTLPDIIFLFGLSGSGKSFVGDAIAHHYGWHVFHGDTLITPAMQQALHEQRPFTDEMRDDFFSQLADHISILQQQYTPLIITQAAYKQRHRGFLQKQFPGMEFIWVRASEATIQSRLQSRREGISRESAQALHNDFEISPELYKHIDNEGDVSNILWQFQNLYFKKI